MGRKNAITAFAFCCTNEDQK